MSRFTNREFMYHKQPLNTDQNRDEHFLIEVPGNWVPECDLIFYGLLNSEYSEKYYKLANRAKFDPHETYLDTCFLEAPDLVRYLASDTEDLADLPNEEIARAIGTAIMKYLYVPCNETMLRHSIIEASYFKFIKSITLVYPWPIRDIDKAYLKRIIPKEVSEKYRLTFSTSIPELLKSEEVKSAPHHFTTIIMNSLEDLEELIDHSNEYRVYDTFFLLRNHSGNVSYTITPDLGNTGKETIEFEEIRTLNILQKLMDIRTGLPKSQIRFARYEPLLFHDAKPDPKEFQIGQ